MKIFVAICDDENRVASELESILIEIFSNFSIKYEIDVYYTGAALYKAMESSDVHYDLIFLDIEFSKEEINGVEVGRHIRDVNRNNDVSIVYISWEKKYSMELFDTQPLNFIIKPLIYENVEKVVKKYLDLAGLWTSHFTYQIGQDVYKVKMKDIVYLESLDRKLMIHLSDGSQDEFYGSLRTVYQEQLQKYDFLYIHSAYVVNYDFVEHYAYEELKLEDINALFSISQGRRKEVRAKYHTIMEKRRT